MTGSNSQAMWTGQGLFERGDRNGNTEPAGGRYHHVSRPVHAARHRCSAARTGGRKDDPLGKAGQSRLTPIHRPACCSALSRAGRTSSCEADCASELARIGFDGYALGGLSVGEGHEEMIATVTHTTQRLPEDRPRYLMGVGMPKDIIAAVAGRHRHVRLRPAHPERRGTPSLSPKTARCGSGTTPT